MPQWSHSMTMPAAKLGYRERSMLFLHSGQTHLDEADSDFFSIMLGMIANPRYYGKNYGHK